MSAAAALFRREVLRFVRQRNRIIGAVGAPLVFWALIGSGVGTTFRVSEGRSLSYLQYFFPGAMALTLLFTAIFSTISIIEDRREGFLQGVMVAPIDRTAIVWGKLLGGACLASLQALIFLLFAPFLGVSLSFGGFLAVVFMLFILAFGLTGLGFVIAWRLDSVQGFHALMNLFLMPLWFLSGALFPAAGAPAWLRTVMKLNPLSYGVAALQKAFYGQQALAGAGLPSYGMSAGVLLIFAGAMFRLAAREASRK